MARVDPLVRKMFLVLLGRAARDKGVGRNGEEIRDKQGRREERTGMPKVNVACNVQTRDAEKRKHEKHEKQKNLRKKCWWRAKKGRETMGGGRLRDAHVHHS